jgi:hypothetical protein
MEQDLGIAVGSKKMPLGERRTELTKVVDLAVERHRERRAWAEHRLLATQGIDDAEPRCADDGRTKGEEAAIVWPTMTETGKHFRDKVAIATGVGVMDVEDACYATHR